MGLAGCRVCACVRVPARLCVRVRAGVKGGRLVWVGVDGYECVGVGCGTWTYLLGSCPQHCKTTDNMIMLVVILYSRALLQCNLPAGHYNALVSRP